MGLLLKAPLNIHVLITSLRNHLWPRQFYSIGKFETKPKPEPPSITGNKSARGG